MDKLFPGEVAYTICYAVQLRGELDVDSLREAIFLTVELHPGLRATFEDSSGVPIRVVNPTPDRESILSILHASDLQSRYSAADLRDLIAPLARRQFPDLSLAPLFAFSLVLVAPEVQILVINLHHIIADGWSLSILMEDLEKQYQAARTGTRFFRLPPQIESASVVAEHDYAEDLAYWRKRLADLPSELLRPDMPRGSVQTFGGSRHVHFIDGQTTKKLEAIAVANKTSLYGLLLTACAVVMSQRSGMTDVVIGSPVANRESVEDETAIGLFVNSVILRINCAGDPLFSDLLAEVRRVTLEALEHQRVPFDRIVSTLNPERSASHNPLFQVFFALQTTAKFFDRFAGLDAQILDLDSGATRFDLEWTLFRHADGISIRLTRNKDLFLAESADALISAFSRVLESVASRVDQRISKLNFDAAHALGHPDDQGTRLCLHHLFERQAKESPTAVALTFMHGDQTYAQLDCAAQSLAVAILALRIPPQSVVAVAVDRTPSLIIAILGVLKAGCCVLTVDVRDPEEHKRFVIDDASVAVIIVDGSWTPLSVRVPVVNIFSVEPHSEMAPSLDVRVTPNDLAYVIYTSGTTGQPKGVMIEHRNVVNTLLAAGRAFGFRSGDSMPVIASHTFDIFFFELFSPLLFGGRAILVDRDQILDPVLIAELLPQVTCMQAVPGLLAQMISALTEAKCGQCVRMRQITTGGDIVPPQIFPAIANAFPNAEISVTYGPTETAILASRFVVSDPASVVGYPIGCALDGVKLVVCNPDGTQVPNQTLGEIWIGGHGVGRGYLNREHESAAKFVQIDGHRFYRTGDLGRMSADGQLEFVGRRDNQVKVRGFRIELQDVEATLSMHPGVSQVVAAAPKSLVDEPSLIGYVIAERNWYYAHENALIAQRLDDWSALFDSVHHDDYDNNFAGWRSSLDDLPIPPHEMGVWLEDTLFEIERGVGPDVWGRDDLRILEIGCGTGLLVERLRVKCSAYHATDASHVLVRRLKDRSIASGWRNVEVIHAIGALLPEHWTDYDLAIINSVSQYSPTSEYLQQMLEMILLKTRLNGVVFVGDVRNLCLLRAFHAWVLTGASRNPDTAPLASDLDERVRCEDELFLDPRFFLSMIQREQLRVSNVRIVPKKIKSKNELSMFRYAAVIRRGQRESNYLVESEWLNWDDIGSLQTLSKALQTQRPAHLGIRGIPNSHLKEAIAALEGIGQCTPRVRPDVEWLEPSQFVDTMTAHGYAARLSLASCSAIGAFDAYLALDGLPIDDCCWPIASVSAHALANQPLRAAADRSMERELRRFVRDRRPKHLVPDRIVFLEQFPLTLNDKVDRNSLPPVALRSVMVRSNELVSDSQRLVASVWAEVLQIHKISAGDNFFELGGTSLLAVQMAIRMKREGVEIRPQQLFKHQTVEELAEEISASRVSSSGAVAFSKHEHHDDWARDLPTPRILDADFLADGRPVCLAGATGYLGSHVLRTLLRESHNPVVCLVRGSDAAAALERLCARYSAYFGEPLIRERVHVLSVDISTFAPLKTVVEQSGTCPATIINAAADVRHVADRAEIFRANVQGTRSLIELARAFNSTLHHISTIGVFGVTKLEQCEFLETDEPGQEFAEHYSESKAEAEWLIRTFQRKAPASIYRVGTVGPHSESGHFQVNLAAHFFTRYLRSLVATGIAPTWSQKSFALTPVDFLARAVVGLARRASVGVIHHLETPFRISHGQVVDALQDYGYAIRVIPDAAFERSIMELESGPDWWRALEGFAPSLQARSSAQIKIGSERTRQLLGRIDLLYPEMHDAWFHRFLDHCVTAGMLPRPRHWQVKTFGQERR